MITVLFIRTDRLSCINIRVIIIERGTFFRLLMSPNKGETAVHGCHCRGDMVVSMRKVMAIRLWYVCFSPNIDIASGIWN